MVNQPTISVLLLMQDFEPKCCHLSQSQDPVTHPSAYFYPNSEAFVHVEMGDTVCIKLLFIGISEADKPLPIESKSPDLAPLVLLLLQTTCGWWFIVHHCCRFCSCSQVITTYLWMKIMLLPQSRWENPLVLIKHRRTILWLMYIDFVLCTIAGVLI